MNQEQANELFRAVGRIEGKQDLMLARLTGNDSRVLRLESRMNYGAGALGSLVFAWPLAWAYLKTRIGL